MATQPIDEDGMPMLPDNPPSVEDVPLAPIELRAKAHWERFRPRLVQELRAKGGEPALDSAIRAAWWSMEYGILLTQAKNPTLHRLQVEELFQEELFPPPEPSPTPARAR
jgi:hypothetical protein